MIKLEIIGELSDDVIHTNAHRLNIEGPAKLIDAETVRIIACGLNENIDDFVDSLYKGYKNAKPSIIEVEPFLRDRDYRGVFRLIE